MIPALDRITPRPVPRLRTITSHEASELSRAVAARDVRQELDDEEKERERRRAAREHRARAGRPMHCDGCYWIVRDLSQPCPRCGYTNGYGYPR